MENNNAEKRKNLLKSSDELIALYKEIRAGYRASQRAVDPSVIPDDFTECADLDQPWFTGDEEAQSV